MMLDTFRKPARLAALEFTERELRDLLVSPYGPNCGQTIVEAAQNGRAIIVNMADGTTLTISDGTDALRVMHQTFGWRPAET
jgi:hypothetical protein